MSRPVFSFAIVNWNTRELLEDCLTSIYQVAGDFPIQVLVADNDSGDGSAEMVEANFPQATLVRTGGNLGFAGGHKPLFELSQGTYHVLVNSDVRLLPGCLERWVEVMEGDEEIGVMGCQLIGPDGEIQPGCRRFPNLWYQLIEASGINRPFAKSPLINAYKMGGFDHKSSRAVDQVMGSLFLIRAEVIEKIGYLDTGYFMYYEEVDYCLRARQAGYKIYFDAESRVYHEGGGSSRKVKVLTIRRTMRSMRRYFAKHLGGWSWLPLIFIVSLDVVTHFFYALVTGQQPLQTLKAYGLGWWDVLRFQRADL